MALIRADSLECFFFFLTEWGKRKLKPELPIYFSFQVLLKTHPEKLDGIQQFKIKTSFILLCLR